jgi:xanthine/uracil permease
LVKATLDSLKFAFGVMIIAALVFALVSLSHSMPSLISGLAIGIVGTKIVGTALEELALLAKRKIEEATMKEMLLVLAVELMVVVLPFRTTGKVRMKLFEKFGLTEYSLS